VTVIFFSSFPMSTTAPPFVLRSAAVGVLPCRSGAACCAPMSR
jgi:hypothetical protein